MAIKELFNDARPLVLFAPSAAQRIDTRFKFSRATSGTYVGPDGFIRTAQGNEARIDHDPVTLAANGLLIEGTSSNAFAYSEDFSAWTNDNAANSDFTTATAAPDGSLNAYKIVPDPGVTGRIRSGPSGAGVLYGLVIYSVYAKAGEYDWLNFQYFASISFSNYFNVKTGELGATSRRCAIEPAGNGWYRCIVYGNTTNVNFVNFIPASSNGVAAVGNGSSGIYAWGAQAEISAAAPSSYIKTTGTSQVARGADLISYEGPLPASGSIYIDAQSESSAVDSTLISAANDDDEKITLAIREPASLYNSKALVYEVDGAFKPTLPFPVPSNARERNLITYGANNYHYRSDSSRLTPSSSTNVPVALTRLGIGHDVTDPTNNVTGYINTVYLWPGEITPTVAEALVRGDLDPKDADAGAFTPEAGALAFVFNTQGTATDGNRVVQLPVSGSTNNILVDWGDNTSSSFIGAAASSTVSHTYPSAGIYPVQITADDDGTNSALENLNFFNSSQRNDLVRVLQWGGTTTWNPTTMYRAFYGCTQLDFENAARTNLPDTSLITDWRDAFFDCSSISGTFPTFDTSAATNFTYTWGNCSSLQAFPFINTSNVTNFTLAWERCSSLTSFPLIDTSAGTTLNYTWSGCSSLASFPLINTGAATNFAQAWNGCSSLTSFPAIDTSNGTNFSRAWNGCSSLASFPLIDTSAGADFSVAWNNCSSLTSFPLINTAAGTNFSNAWNGCNSLTSFPLINTAAGTNFSAAWVGCSSLTSFPLINTAAGTNFGLAWVGCSSLTSFPLINTAAGTNFSRAWEACSSLTSFPLINTAAGTNFSRAWSNNDGLTAFPALNFDSATGLASDASSGYTGFREAWFSCGALADFPANRFDNTTCTRYLDAFTSCALTATSIENIIVSIEAAGTSNGNLSLQGGTNAGASTWTAAAVTAYDALVARGWTITRNA